MLKAVDCKDQSQTDIVGLGRIMIECLEPGTFIKQGEALENDWDAVLMDFQKSTNSMSASELLEVCVWP